MNSSIRSESLAVPSKKLNLEVFTICDSLEKSPEHGLLPDALNVVG